MSCKLWTDPFNAILFAVDDCVLCIRHYDVDTQIVGANRLSFAMGEIGGTIMCMHCSHVTSGLCPISLPYASKSLKTKQFHMLFFGT